MGVHAEEAPTHFQGINLDAAPTETGGLTVQIESAGLNPSANNTRHASDLCAPWRVTFLALLECHLFFLGGQIKCFGVSWYFKVSLF